MRLFAALRDIAGDRELDVSGDTALEIVEALTEKFGARFGDIAGAGSVSPDCRTSAATPTIVSQCSFGSTPSNQMRWPMGSRSVQYRRAIVSLIITAPGARPAIPSGITAEGMDQAALVNCVGGAFYPGIEAGWLSRNPGVYSEPFRIKRGGTSVDSHPGVLSFQDPMKTGNQIRLARRGFSQLFRIPDGIQFSF